MSKAQLVVQSASSIVVTPPAEARSAIATYDAMVRAIRECHDIDMAAQMQSQAAALAVYHAQARDSESENLMREIRIRAQRRAGQILEQMKADGTRRKQHVVARNADPSAPPTLAALGITGKESSNWQALAKVPEEKFEQHLSDAREAGKPAVMRDVVALSRGKKPTRARTDAASLSACLVRLCNVRTAPEDLAAMFDDEDRPDIKNRLDEAVGLLLSIQQAWRV